jgi:hypothetical protein
VDGAAELAPGPEGRTHAGPLLLAHDDAAHALRAVRRLLRGHDADSTRLVIDSRARYRRHARLDMDYLLALCERIGRGPQLRTALTWRPSSSLYRIAGQVRYADARVNGRSRSYRLVAAQLTPYLEATLERCADGARLAVLAQALVEDDVTLEEARTYVEELADAGLIVPDLEPPVTGGEPIQDLVAQLRAATAHEASAAPLAHRVDEARAALDALDAAPLGVEPSHYRAVAAELSALPVEVDLARAFQVTFVQLVKERKEVVLRGAVLDRVLQPALALHRSCARARALRLPGAAV